MNATNQQIADWYGISRATLHNYKTGDAFKRRLYEAMIKYYEENMLQ